MARVGGTARKRAGSTAWKHAGGCVRAAPPGVRVAPLKLDRPIVRVLGVHYDGRGVTVPGLLSTMHEM